ncbi:thiamine-phosphate kinase [Halospina denitrificans]|uniref:Thiamine-monophosphate kinase n=1 Tax=Halospina denitrificans TaxID=332522 RepID=A0A4R7JH10_9GAMM|nr:thiamine-phosphate kinase [Halospina denitrificans]TDT37101.1 thiamine-phosphate kinase [Halospina denitrificans]
MDEISLIRRFWEPLGRAVTHPAVREGIGNDGAVIRCEPGQDAVVAVDTLVEGVHFPATIDPYALGWRALAVNLSDLAAMGAEPVCYTLALTLPRADEDWLEAFSGGLRDLSVRHGIQLVGGDTTRGPLTITIQVQGRVPSGTAMRRGGAAPGDRVCVSGSLGSAGEALKWLDTSPGNNPDVRAVLARYFYPQPRLALGGWLRERGVAAIDVSDGLVSDLGQLLGEAGRGARLDYAALPIAPELATLAGSQARKLAASAGDDYELCFLWPLALGEVPESTDEGVPLTVIGEVEAEPGVRLMDGNDPVELAYGGYSHFSGGANDDS